MQIHIKGCLRPTFILQLNYNGNGNTYNVYLNASKTLEDVFPDATYRDVVAIFRMKKLI